MSMVMLTALMSVITTKLPNKARVMVVPLEYTNRIRCLSDVAITAGEMAFPFSLISTILWLRESVTGARRCVLLSQTRDRGG